MARGKSGKAGLPAPVQEAAVVVMMTADEAEQVCGQIDRSLSEARALLLELHDREGWKALGFGSWRECVVARFAQHQSYLYRQLQAGQLEQELDLPIGTLPESHARELARVPAEKRAEVLEAVSPNGDFPLRRHVRKVTAKAIAEAAAQVCKFRVDDVVLTPDGKRAVVTALLKGKARVDDGGAALAEHPIESLALIRHEAIFGVGERVINYGQGSPRHGAVQSVHLTQGVAVVAFDDGGQLGCDLWRLDPEPEPEGLLKPQVGNWVRLPGSEELHEVKSVTDDAVFLSNGNGGVFSWAIDEIAGVYQQNSLLELTDEEQVIVEQNLAALEPEVDQVHPGDIARFVTGDEHRVLKAGNKWVVLEGDPKPRLVAAIEAVQREGVWHRLLQTDRPPLFEAVQEEVQLSLTLSREVWEAVSALSAPRVRMAIVLEQALKQQFDLGELV